jgi:hypothetical protein
MIALLLCGCSEPTQPPPPKTKLYEPQREALDKAKTVEQTVQDKADQQKEDISHQAE